jgi:hypothetical protein
MNNEDVGDILPKTRRRNPYTASGRGYISNEFSNVSTDAITITHDKLENILIKSYEKRHWRTAWINPLSLIITLCLSLATSDFKSSALGVDASTWRSIFMLVSTGSCIWLIWSLIQLKRNWDGSSIEALINRIKNVNPDT